MLLLFSSFPNTVQARRLVSSNAEKLYESGLDGVKALREMDGHVGQLLGWASTHIPVGTAGGALVHQKAAPVLSLCGGRSGAPAPQAAPSPSAQSDQGWRGGRLDMGPNSRQGRWYRRAAAVILLARIVRLVMRLFEAAGFKAMMHLIVPYL